MKKSDLVVFFAASVVFFIAGCGVIEGEESPIVIHDGDLSIHFLELGNEYTGDCVFINYGDTEIIIDAGSRQSSAATIKNYIDEYINDNTLEFVIVTHADQDHIDGFYSSASVEGILEAYKIGTIIEFPRTNKDPNARVYGNYLKAREAAIVNGAAYYTALECYKESVDGAKRFFCLGGDVKLEILYNYYYENYTSDENDYSVCVKIIQGENQYIFTGDLLRTGEEKLVNYYEEKYDGLGHCVLYKGGHHGSRTSSTEQLMAAITPEYVCVCSCVGSSQFNASHNNVFPSQDFINRVAPHTDEVYITTLVTDYKNHRYESFNGDIVFLAQNGNFRIICSNNNFKLKDTEWFKANRTMPLDWEENFEE